LGLITETDNRIGRYTVQYVYMQKTSSKNLPRLLFRYNFVCVSWKREVVCMYFVYVSIDFTFLHVFSVLLSTTLSPPSPPLHLFKTHLHPTIDVT